MSSAFTAPRPGSPASSFGLATRVLLSYEIKVSVFGAGRRRAKQWYHTFGSG